MATRTSTPAFESDPQRGPLPHKASPSAFSRRAGKTIKAAIDEFLLDCESQHYSPKTIKWHTQALAHLANFLEQQDVTHLWMLEPVHLRAWMVFLEKQPSAKGPELHERCAGMLSRCKHSVAG